MAVKLLSEKQEDSYLVDVFLLCNSSETKSNSKHITEHTINKEF
jgi:hypothetical protein